MKIKRQLLLSLYCCASICVLQAQATDIRMFIFGHSLIDHRPPAIPTPSNETTVPHWIYLLAESADYSYAAGGQYGFLPQHANVPPISQWGYDLVPPVWESDTEPFSAADITTVLITAGNFMQWQAPDAEYPGDPGVSPVSATETVVNWVNDQEEEVTFYIYENWPDMAPFLANGFPPSTTELEQYHNTTMSTFHDWWLQYQDLLLASQPEVKIRMIPVGPIISGVLTELIPNQIPVTDLYEDDAPHGRPTLYFLAGLISYMAIYGEEAPDAFVVPETVSSVIQDQYEAIADYCWQELLAFNDANGASRVFYELPSSLETTNEGLNIRISPNPATEYIQIEMPFSNYSYTLSDLHGKIMQEMTIESSQAMISLHHYPKGIYLLRVTDQDSGKTLVQKVIKS